MTLPETYNIYIYIFRFGLVNFSKLQLKIQPLPLFYSNFSKLQLKTQPLPLFYSNWIVQNFWIISTLLIVCYFLNLLRTNDTHNLESTIESSPLLCKSQILYWSSFKWNEQVPYCFVFILHNSCLIQARESNQTCKIWKEKKG